MRFKTSTLSLVVIFALVTGSLVVMVGITFSQIRIESSKSYKAVFSDASGLRKNVDVRGSGVAIGSVKSIELRPQGGVLVSFTVPKTLKVTRSTQARIRYANLTGDRYLDLTPGKDPDAAALPVNAVIPEERTQPALELDDLFAGFDPLMQALDPEEVNELTSNIIGLTEGQSGAYESMLANVASFTTHLSERDELIGSVIKELSTTLDTLGDRRGEVDKLVVDLDNLVDKLDKNRTQLVGGLASLSSLGTQVARFLEAVRPGLKANVDNLGVVAKNLNSVEPYIRETLSHVKVGLQRAGRLSSNGSMFNFFLCGVRVKVDVPGTGETSESPTSIISPTLYAKNDRCKKGAN